MILGILLTSLLVTELSNFIPSPWSYELILALHHFKHQALSLKNNLLI